MTVKGNFVRFGGNTFSRERVLRMRVAGVSGLVLAEWREGLKKFGFDPAELAALTIGGDRATQTEAAAIPLGVFVEALETVAQSHLRPDLAWMIGHAVDDKTGGKVAKAVLGSRTLGAALRRLCEFLPLVQDATSAWLDIGDQWTTLGYRILAPSIWPRHEDAMYSLGAYSRLIKAAAPEAWRHVEITVEAERDFVKANLSEVTRANVLYGGAANLLSFPTSTLDCALNLAPPLDPSCIADLSRDLGQKRRSMKLCDRAREMIFHNISFGAINQEELARELGISSRTLRRKLAKENVSFKSLVDDCRMQCASLEFRARKDLSLSEMALRLGYSDHSTFSRAFSRWSGMPPQDYRRILSAC